MAKHYLASIAPTQIAITGSQGKTYTSHVLHSVLKSLGPTIATDINLDTVYNVPITALRVKPWTQFVLFELGIDHPGEMTSHLSVTRPRIGVVTGVSPVHTDAEHLGSFENLIEEKRKLIEDLPKNGYAVLNGNDANVRDMAAHTKAKVLFYGARGHGDVHAENIRASLAGLAFDLHDTSALHDKDNPSKKKREDVVRISTRLIGRHHVGNIMAAYLVYKALHGNRPLSSRLLNLFRSSVASLVPLTGRMSLEEGPSSIRILNDALRANPASMAAGIETVSELEYRQGGKYAVLGEMGELADPKKEHEDIGRVLAASTIDMTVLIGPHHRHTYDMARRKGLAADRLTWVRDVFTAAKVLKIHLKPHDLLYIKGSLMRHMERIILLLMGEKVGCNVVSCPFYHQCTACEHLRSGYKG